MIMKRHMFIRLTCRTQSGEYIPAVHSQNGLLGVSLPDIPVVSLDAPVLATTRELPGEFPYQPDVNAGNPIGVGWTQSSIANGTRSDSNSAYIQKILTRPNLTVLTNAQVTKLVKTGLQNGLPIFRSVEFASNSSGTTNGRVVNAKFILLQ
jgi:choline dehydrogenase-like flavoprotein